MASAEPCPDAARRSMPHRRRGRRVPSTMRPEFPRCVSGSQSVVRADAGLDAPRPRTDREDPVPAAFDRPLHPMSGRQVVDIDAPAMSPLVEALAVGEVARQIPAVQHEVPCVEVGKQNGVCRHGELQPHAGNAPCNVGRRSQVRSGTAATPRVPGPIGSRSRSVQATAAIPWRSTSPVC